MFFSKKSFYQKNVFFSEIFLPPNIISFGTQVGAGRKKMPWLHPEGIFDEGRYSRNLPTQRYVKNFAKTGFLTLANPTPKTFLRGCTGGRWCKYNANRPHNCVGRVKK